MNFSRTSKMKYRITRSAAAFIFVFISVATTHAADFDRDGKADLTVFRPASSSWICETSSEKIDQTDVRWGNPTDVLVPADYDGDGQTDVAVWRPENGVWYIHPSGNGGAVLIKWGMTTMHPTGGLPDVPVPADYDGDGRADLAVWRPDTGQWWVLRSSLDYDQDRPEIFRWGKLGDVPVQADYDGDRNADYAIFRPTENRWYIRESRGGKSSTRDFGLAGLDRLVPADYNGDGKVDVAVYRSGVWYVMDSESGETEIFHLGFTDDVPVPADYDGDHSIDFAVYRNGTWYFTESSSGRFRSFNFGQVDDVPVSSGVIRQSVVAIP